MGSSDPANGGTGGYTFEDFERLDRIGSGGTADVYQAQVDEDGRQRQIAVKTPRLADYETVDASFFDAFVDEASIWSRIDDHDHIVSVLDWGTEPYPWIAMEYMDAGHLGDLIAELSRERRVAVFRDVCTAVYHAHRHGITHGDLKPENVLFTRSSGELVPKVGDWGLAKVLLDHSRSRDGLTMAYSAPEQLDPDAYGPTDDRTDVYQLSAVAYELFTGAPPFEASGTGELVHRILNDTPTPPSARADLPEALDDAILRGLAKDREERYETILYLRDAVEEAMSAPSKDSEATAVGAEDAADDGTGKAAVSPATDTSTNRESRERGDERASATGTASATPTRTKTTTRAVDSAETTGDTDASSTPTETDPDDDADQSDEAPGLSGRLHRPVESMAHGRDVVRSMAFALQYPRSARRRTLYNWWLVALASILLVPAPLMVGYFLEIIEEAATGRAPTFRLGDGAWRRHYRRGLVGAGFVLGPFMLFTAVSTPAGVNESTTVEGVLALLTVVSWVLLPGLLSEYATGGLSALATRDHWRRYATADYLGTLVGVVVVGLLAYLVTAGLAITIVGIAVAYFYLMVVVGGFLGRRA